MTVKEMKEWLSNKGFKLVYKHNKKEYEQMIINYCNINKIESPLK